MKEALSSILCGEKDWQIESESRNNILFFDNGIGEIYCCRQASAYICAEFEWRFMWPEVLELLLDTSNNTPNKTKLVIEFEIEIQVTKRRPAQFRTPSELRRPLNEAHLKDEAFLPKIFTVKLEKGNFSSPSYLDKALDWLLRFELRLVFDKSPYPAQHEWNGLLTSSPDDIKMWEWKKFCGRPSTKLKRPRTGFLSWLHKLNI